MMRMMDFEDELALWANIEQLVGYYDYREECDA